MVDGFGGFYEAMIQTEDPAAVALIIIKEQQNYGARNFRLHIALAPTKNTDRFEYFLEKAVEIGVDEITPLTCQHSERFKLRMDRLDRIVFSAMKQSYKAFKPKLNALTDFAIAIENAEGLNGIAHCADIPKVHIKQFLSGLQNRTNELPCRINIFIGPEGDFSPEEIMAAESKGFSGISLGASRLRTETAGVIACYAVHHELGIPS